VTTDTTDLCPSCSRVLPAAGNHPVWCAGCEWGLGAVDAPRGGPLRSWRDRRSARMVEALHREVSGAEAGRPGWDAARLASYALACAVHASTLCLLLVAGLLLWTSVNVVTVIVAALLAVGAFFVAPRLGRFPRHDVRFRADAPALFGLLDRVGAEMGARPVDVVVVTAEFNASYGVVGLRRRRVLRLGLPLWDALTGQQRVALLGHELAHGVNGDSRHGLVVGTSLSSLARLHEATRPGGPDRRMNYIVDLLTRALQWTVSSVIAIVFRAQLALTLRAGQRAEYLADDLAAKVASPTAAADTLDAGLVAADTHEMQVRRLALRGDAQFWTDRRDALAALPESERERRRRVAARRRLSVDESHPPTHLRIAVLRGRPDAEPRIRLTSDEETAIAAELEREYDRVARELREAARAALYR
jgi:Zn-dependent protease with chaperone function